MSLALLKLILLLFMALLTLKASTAPNKEQSSDKIERSTIMNKYIHAMTKYFTRPYLLIPNLMLCFVIFSRNVLSTTPLRSITSQDLCSRDTTHELDRLSPLFWAIFLLVAGGSAIRLQCFRTLGKLFTFEVTIRSNHKIVDSGPYAIVRHPSYTATLFMFGGTAFLIFSSQSPVITCGWAASSLIVKLIMASWAFYAAFFSYSLFQRVVFEEKNLQSYFKRDWEEYTKRVPYLYVPGIY